MVSLHIIYVNQGDRGLRQEVMVFKVFQNVVAISGVKSRWAAHS